MKVYHGILTESGTAKVIVIDSNGERELPLRLDLQSRSPAGFAWGYRGAGPKQLALALLADAAGDDDLALYHHQNFKWAVIAVLPPNRGWRITSADIYSWIAGKQKFITGIIVPA